MLGNLKGVEMELRDCAFPLLRDIVATSDAHVAFREVDVAILVGAFPRKKGMERKDLLTKNADIFKVFFLLLFLVCYFNDDTLKNLGSRQSSQ